jgi:DNA polymerase-1
MGRARVSEENEAWVKSPVGRRHVARDLNKIYTLTNYLIQGTAADVFKRALIDVDLAGLGEYLILPVHDELIADVPLEVADEYAQELRRAMRCDDFVVPLTVDVERYQVWGRKYVDVGEDIWMAPDMEEAEESHAYATA